MTRAIRVKGLDKVLGNLNKELKRVKGKTKAGLIKAGLRIKRESQKKCPVDLGNLRASHDVVWSGRARGRGDTTPMPVFKGEEAGQMAEEHVRMKTAEKVQLPQLVVEVIVSAAYALWVHEKLTSKSGKPIKHKVGEAKFLEKAVNQNQNAIVNIVRKAARI